MNITPDHVSADIQGQVVIRGERVHVLFSRVVEGQLRPAETDNLQLDPPAAVRFAELLTDRAFEADTTLKPAGSTLKASLVEQHRTRLIPRIALMLNSQREQRTVSNEVLARQIMDAVCKEVFT